MITEGCQMVRMYWPRQRHLDNGRDDEEEECVDATGFVSQLPDELWLRILTFLTNYELCLVSLTCRQGQYTIYTITITAQILILHSTRTQSNRLVSTSSLVGSCSVSPVTLCCGAMCLWWVTLCPQPPLSPASSPGKMRLPL